MFTLDNESAIKLIDCRLNFLIKDFHFFGNLNDYECDIYFKLYHNRFKDLIEWDEYSTIGEGHNIIDVVNDLFKQTTIIKSESEPKEYINKIDNYYLIKK